MAVLLAVKFLKLVYYMQHFKILNPPWHRNLQQKNINFDKTITHFVENAVYDRRQKFTSNKSIRFHL